MNKITIAIIAIAVTAVIALVLAAVTWYVVIGSKLVPIGQTLTHYSSVTQQSNVNFKATTTSSTLSSLPIVNQPGGFGILFMNGTAVFVLNSTGSVNIVSALISMNNITYTVNRNSIIPYQLTAGLNKVTINFGSSITQYINPELSYNIELALSDGTTVFVAVVPQ